MVNVWFNIVSRFDFKYSFHIYIYTLLSYIYTLTFSLYILMSLTEDKSFWFIYIDRFHVHVHIGFIVYKDKIDV